MYLYFYYILVSHIYNMFQLVPSSDICGTVTVRVYIYTVVGNYEPHLSMETTANPHEVRVNLKPT